MRDITSNADERYCRCGALCDGNNSRCPKCRYRTRWLRRKSWRCNHIRTLSPDSPKGNDLT
jgi:hypothetical protein